MAQDLVPAEQGERALLGFWGGGASGMGCRGVAGVFKGGCPEISGFGFGKERCGDLGQTLRPLREWTLRG